MTSIPWDELMDAAGDSDFSPIPPGDYDVKITSCEATKSSTDKPMWKLTCAVLGGPHEGRKVWTQQTLTMDNNNALNVFFRQMAAAGLTAEFFKMKPSNQEIADALLGRTFRAKIIIENYMSQDRNKIKNWAPASGALGAPPPGVPPMGGTPPPPGGGSAGTPPPPPPPTTSAPTTPPTSSVPPPPPPPPPTGSSPTPPPPTPPTSPGPDNEPTGPDNEPDAPSTPAPPDNTPGGPENEPAPPSNTGQPQPQPVTASAAPAATPGGANPSDWVVEPRATGSMEEPPF